MIARRYFRYKACEVRMVVDEFLRIEFGESFVLESKAMNKKDESEEQ
jgi:hypothetical protein